MNSTSLTTHNTVQASPRGPRTKTRNSLPAVLACAVLPLALLGGCAKDDPPTAQDIAKAYTEALDAINFAARSRVKDLEVTNVKCLRNEATYSCSFTTKGTMTRTRIRIDKNLETFNEESESPFGQNGVTAKFEKFGDVWRVVLKL